MFIITFIKMEMYKEKNEVFTDVIAFDMNFDDSQPLDILSFVNFFPLSNLLLTDRI